MSVYKRERETDKQTDRTAFILRNRLTEREAGESYIFRVDQQLRIDAVALNLKADDLNRSIMLLP